MAAPDPNFHVMYHHGWAACEKEVLEPLLARCQRLEAALQMSNEIVDWWLRTSYHEQRKDMESMIGRAKGAREAARAALQPAPEVRG